MNDPDARAPRPSSADVRRLMAAELSRPARLAYVALLLVALAGASVTASLAFGEAGLPTRTFMALLVLTSINLAWSGFAAWVLTRRHVMLTGHRVIAARMAVFFTALLTVGALSVGLFTGADAGWQGTAAAGAVMFVVAATMLVRARRRFDTLLRRRAELERELGGTGGDAG